MDDENESPAGQGGALNNKSETLSDEKDSSKSTLNQEDTDSERDDWKVDRKRGVIAHAWSAERTDLANARRLVREHGPNLHYCASLKAWFVWDGCLWRRDENGQVLQLAKSVSDMIAREAISEADDEKKSALLRWAAASQSRQRIEAIVELAKSEPGIPISPKALDADPNRLGVKNGTLDLANGRLVPPARSDLITKLAPVDLDDNAKCPMWKEFIHKVTDGDEKLASFLARMAGYFLTGSTAEQCIFFIVGSGANGKSIFLNVLQAMLGDYATTTPPETLLTRPSTGPTPDLARLRGARLILASEPPESMPINEALVKRLTGQDVIVCRALYSNLFEFRPSFKVVMAANHTPEVRGTDHAIWRRIHLIKFGVTIPEAQQDKQLFEKLISELPGILNWALAGLRDYATRGLDPPQTVRAANAAYRSKMDVVQQWIDERCVLSPTATTTGSTLYASYSAFCRSGGFTPLTERKFGDDLDDRGFPRSRTARARGRDGIALKTVQERDDGDDRT